MNRVFLTLALCIALAGCQPATEVVSPTGPANAIDRLDLGEIETGTDGRCFARMDQPTQTSIVEEMELVIPETRDANGAVTAPPVFRTFARPQTVATGEGRRFETLCPPQYTHERVATLQRALRVRGTYAGPIHGTLDTATGNAIRQFQAPSGVQSNLLGIETARLLGVIATPIAQLERR